MVGRLYGDIGIIHLNIQAGEGIQIVDGIGQDGRSLTGSIIQGIDGKTVSGLETDAVEAASQYPAYDGQEQSGSTQGAAEYKKFIAFTHDALLSFLRYFRKALPG